VKFHLLALTAAPLAFAQSTTTTYTTDLLNGGQSVTSVSASTDHTQSQIVQSINGRDVPLEQRQEKLIRQDENGSVTESIVKRYDGTGQLASTERVVTETRKRPDGGSSTRSTIYRSDINGQEQLAERRAVDTAVSGLTTTTNTVVDQPSINGTFQTVEKRAEVMTTSADKKSSTTTESIYRNGSDGGFREASRRVTTQVEKANQTVVDTTDYEPGVNAGALQFQERRISTEVSAPDGSHATTVDIYAPSADGHVQDADARPQLKQQQFITRVAGPSGVIETFSIREPSVSEANHLGPLRQINQVVCTGNCATGAPVVEAPPKQ